MKKVTQSLQFWFAESFLPFVLLIIALFLALQYVDNLIENRDTTLTIRLDSGDGDEEQTISITQQIDLTFVSDAEQKKQLIEINDLLENDSHQQALDLIIQLDPSVLQEPEVKMTQAYCQMKLGNTRKAEELLLQINGDENPRLYYNLGLLYGGQKGRNREAIIAYEKYLQKNPNSYEALMNLGWLYYKRKEYDQAHEFYTKAASLSRSEREVRALYRLGMIAERRGQGDEAAEIYRKALKKAPGDNKVRIALSAMMLEKNLPGAVESMVKTIELNPRGVRGYYLLGKYYNDHDELNLASKWLRQGVKQAPQDLNLNSLLGHVYLKAEEWEQARLVYERLVARYSSKALYHFNLGKAYSGKDDNELALLSYARAIEIDPGYYEAILNSGVIYAREERYDEAIQWYKRAIALKPGEARVYYNLGVLYRNSNRDAEALEAFGKAVSLSKKYPSALLNIGVLYSRRDQNKKAVQYYRRAIEQNPAYTLAYYNLSLLLESMGRVDESLLLLEGKVKKLNDHRIYARYASGYKQKGEWKKAKEYYQVSLKLKPAYSTAQLGIAEVYLHEKKYDEVSKLAKEYLYNNPKDTEMRYFYMVAAFYQGNQKFALKQYNTLKRLSPNFEDPQKIVGKLLKASNQ